MTPLEIADAARRSYNVSAGDSFFSDTQMYEWIYDACMRLATEAFLIEKVYTTTTTSGTQEYSYPTNAFAIKKVTYDGEKLDHITFREDDLLTGGDQDITDTGTPVAFVDFAQTFYLRPIPDAANTLKVWAYAHPAGIPTASTTLDLPDEWHIRLLPYLLMQMSAKDKNFGGANYFESQWERVVSDAVRFAQKKRRGGQYRVVQNIDVLPTDILGTV